MFATVENDRRRNVAPREVLRLGESALPTWSVASGEQFGIALVDVDTNRVALARVDGKGQLIGAVTNVKATDAPLDSLALQPTPDGYAVAWIDTRGAFIARIARDGKRIGDTVEIAR